MIKNKTVIFFIIGLVIAFNQSSGQGFLHADGKNIVDGSGNIFIIRSIGTGNWMLQEGYMMKTAGVAGTQHEFRNKLISTIGEAKTDSFYNKWLENHFTRADVDSMKVWGFNAVRPALHYKWFTLPIEEEPVAGQNTWLEKGFTMLDSLVAWCRDNEMYVILDMHGTPGGQGTNADISDYDPSKPSLWESQANKDKLIALWKKLAERYSNEIWVGGYDLINETNWSFSEPNNQPLWNLFKDLTVAIREVDTNHLLFLEGNWFANDYGGLPAIWDNNMALSFHKYWTYNDANSLSWMTNLQDERNVPLWLGESGENSNSWFTSLIALAEGKNIGWSWWPVKKAGINNVMQVTTNADYEQLIKSWRGEASPFSADATYNAVMSFAENHNIKNCTIKYDVIDAMIRQPHSFETKPFKKHVVGSEIYFSDYDFGRNNHAYFDKDTANYSGNTGEFGQWNHGWSYRNDGVDIEPCSDNYSSNGYNVGWTHRGEWMQYTIVNSEEAAYTFEIRSASGGNGSKLHFEVNDIPVSPTIVLPSTGGWQTWKSTQVNNIIIPAGESKLKVFIDEEGSNLNYFIYNNPQPIGDLAFEFLSAKTTNNSKKIELTLNKPISELDLSNAIESFTLLVNDAEFPILKVAVSVESDRVIEITTYNDLLYNHSIELSYTGTSVKSGAQILASFNKKLVVNFLEAHLDVPGKIEAEDFLVNQGFEVEDCLDYDEGSNLGYADAGDFVEYKVYVAAAGLYKLDYRVASTQSNGQIITFMGNEQNRIPVDTLTIDNTGGWQTWKTQSAEVKLNAGIQTLRLFVKQGSFNLNWIKFSLISSLKSYKEDSGYKLYPNPARENTTLYFNEKSVIPRRVNVFDLNGKLVFAQDSKEVSMHIDTSNFDSGIYCIWVTADAYKNSLLKLLIN